MEVAGFGWNLLIMHMFFFLCDLQDMEDKARGVLLHISVYMGNDKFKTLKLSDLFYQMNIMYLKDTGNACGFSAAASKPPFQQNTHYFAVRWHAKLLNCWQFSALPRFLNGAELVPVKDKHVPLQFTWKEPQSSTEDCNTRQGLGSRRVSGALPAPEEPLPFFTFTGL